MNRFAHQHQQRLSARAAAPANDRSIDAADRRHAGIRHKNPTQTMAKSKSKLRSSSNTTASSKNNKNTRLRQSSSYSTLSSHSKKSLDNGISNNVDDDDDDVSNGDNSYSDLADNSTSSMNHHHNINEADEDDNDDEFDIRKWTSRHYDNCVDDNSNEAVVRDLYDPKVSNHNTNAKKSYYDDGNCNNGGEGADEDGVFLRYVILLIV